MNPALFIGFASIADAIEHKAEHGGWIFIPHDTDTGAIWFAPQITMSKIFAHPAARGSGRIV